MSGLTLLGYLISIHVYRHNAATVASYTEYSMYADRSFCILCQVDISESPIRKR